MRGFCSYGCEQAKKCQGEPRVEVEAFLEDRWGVSAGWLQSATDAELNQFLVELADVDYQGPSHVRRTA